MSAPAVTPTALCTPDRSARSSTLFCADPELSQTDSLPYASILCGACGLDRVVVPDGFACQVDRAVPDTGLTPVDLDGVDAVVTAATVAVATTGTLCSTTGPDRAGAS